MKKLSTLIILIFSFFTLIPCIFMLLDFITNKNKSLLITLINILMENNDGFIY